MPQNKHTIEDATVLRSAVLSPALYDAANCTSPKRSRNRFVAAEAIRSPHSHAVCLLESQPQPQPQPKQSTRRQLEVLEQARHYEVCIVVSPEADARAPEIKEHIKDWGMRQLAYRIQRFTEGRYLLFNIEADPAIINDIKAYLEKSEAVIRHLAITKKEAISAPSVVVKAMRREKDKAEGKVDIKVARKSDRSRKPAPKFVPTIVKKDE
eukprot:jgi/Chlat1/348/Chrsp10S01521